MVATRAPPVVAKCNPDGKGRRNAKTERKKRMHWSAAMIQEYNRETVVYNRNLRELAVANPLCHDVPEATITLGARRNRMWVTECGIEPCEGEAFYTWTCCDLHKAWQREYEEQEVEADKLESDFPNRFSQDAHRFSPYWWTAIGLVFQYGDYGKPFATLYRVGQTAPIGSEIPTR